MESIVLRRQSSYSSAAFLWKLWQTTAPLHADGTVHFARDYSFRELKADSAVLLGNASSNPWIEPFESRLGLRWKFDEKLGIHFPVDTWAGTEGSAGVGTGALTGEPRDGYSSISFLPNLGGTANVVIVSGTGGSAVGGAADFLSDERSMSNLLSQLRSRLPSKNDPGRFPYFEALIKTKGRGNSPGGASIMICRAPK